MEVQYGKKERKRDSLKTRGREAEKYEYSYGSRGAGKEKSLCWRRPTAINVVKIQEIRRKEMKLRNGEDKEERGEENVLT
jgi:hypothetical protein